ncbi:MAG: glycosyl transferase [Limisphaerales bacterium]|jgi:glucosyl-3-phosphoglycerate synthase|nr:glycosyl transferase [Verrucomicrobiota bacterium]
MTDFYQNGVITTLHNLRHRSLQSIEEELVGFSRQSPMALILPCLYSELEGPALKGILSELAKVPYLSQIVIGLDRADESQYRHALDYFSVLPQPHAVLWNDGPRLQSLMEAMRSEQLAPDQLGKGCNVWTCFGFLLSPGGPASVALHDCDILTYDRSMLARLLYPLAHPTFNFRFCKGYYARYADGKLNGRVARLLVTPLIKAMEQVVGHHEYLSFMDSFRYPLAGEFALRTDAIPDMRLPSDWGLEIGILSEMKRNYSVNRICQVELADVYDHKHQDLSIDDVCKGLSKMSFDIGKAFYRKLATNGVVFTSELIRTIKASYYRIALDFVESFTKDATINGLTLDTHQEESTVELFAENLMKAGHHFLDHPMEAPFIPSWNRVASAMPDIHQQMVRAVEKDMEVYGRPMKKATELAVA